MSKELDALKRIRQETIPATYNQDFDKEECCNIIETALKELENRRATENVVRTFRESPVKTNKKLKALEIIKETPIFAWYITIYKDAYEMIADAKGFRANESAEELQEKFNLLKEVLL